MVACEGRDKRIQLHFSSDKSLSLIVMNWFYIECCLLEQQHTITTTTTTNNCKKRKKKKKKNFISEYSD